MKMIILLISFVLSFSAFASTDRILDAKYITNGAYTLNIPNITGDIMTNSSTDTLSNKTFNAASNSISNVPTLSVIGLSGVNSGDVSISLANGLSLAGQALSLAASSSSASGALTASDWTLFNGKLSSPLTTKGDILTRNGSTHVRLGVTGNNGYVLMEDSTADSGLKFGALPSSAPSVTGSAGSPTLITAAGGISFTGSYYINYAFIAGNGGAIDITANPQIAAGSLVGQHLQIISKDATNTVKLEDGTGLALNGAWIGGLNSVINLTWDGATWIEDSRR
jgi:hypothetical protein